MLQRDLTRVNVDADLDKPALMVDFLNGKMT